MGVHIFQLEFRNIWTGGTKLKTHETVTIRLDMIQTNFWTDCHKKASESDKISVIFVLAVIVAS